MGQCTATAKSTGEQCQRAAIKGGTVCHVHGGAAKQVKEKAQERLDRMADEVTAEVQEIIEDLIDLYHEADEEDKLAIQSAVKGHWLAILNRTGHGPTETRELTGEDGDAIKVQSNVVEVTNLDDD